MRKFKSKKRTMNLTPREAETKKESKIRQKEKLYFFFESGQNQRKKTRLRQKNTSFEHFVAE